MKMSIRQVVVVLVTTLLLPLNTLQADPAEREAILAVTEKLFAAVNSQNPDDWRAFQLAQGTTLSFRPPASGEPGHPELRITSNEEFIAGLQKNEHDYREFWTAEPTVLIRGPIAVVWGAYEFTIDGKFSHCGIDAIDLVKLEGEWKVANIMWTVEKDNCPTPLN
ncbi:MAG TPA: nuclear transport factor 2 family protein [Xanthomonadales bacterium]|nr:nuclear transport factor 2 family protein [Xanthomonadales bacterium]